MKLGKPEFYNPINRKTNNINKKLITTLITTKKQVFQLSFNKNGAIPYILFFCYIPLFFLRFFLLVFKVKSNWQTHLTPATYLSVSNYHFLVLIFFLSQKPCNAATIIYGKLNLKFPALLNCMSKNKTYFDIFHTFWNMQQLTDADFHFRSQSCDISLYRFAKTLTLGTKNVRNKHGASVNTFNIIFLPSW